MWVELTTEPIWVSFTLMFFIGPIRFKHILREKTSHFSEEIFPKKIHCYVGEKERKGNQRRRKMDSVAYNGYRFFSSI